MTSAKQSLLKSQRENLISSLLARAGQGFLFLVTASSLIALIFIFYFISRDAFPFFASRGFTEFFTTAKWYPSGHPAAFGALAIFVGSGIVTLGAVVIAVPLAITAAICLSDILPFSVRQIVKPVIEMLAAIPSVAYGFFALVVFAPALQRNGGHLLTIASWVVLLPIGTVVSLVISDLATDRIKKTSDRFVIRTGLFIALAGAFFFALFALTHRLDTLVISSGTNALNVSVILGIMALPTIVSVSEDALQSVGREIREGSYALGATRAETLIKAVIPAATSGILAAVILGIMRAIGETMVVWMASGNSAQIPDPWYNILSPVRTLTATIAGDMGEADQVTGSDRFHVLFAMAFCLLAFSFVMNYATEIIMQRQRKKLGK
jgi:phosphate transport system permease protein